MLTSVTRTALCSRCRNLYDDLFIARRMPIHEALSSVDFSPGTLGPVETVGNHDSFDFLVAVAASVFAGLLDGAIHVPRRRAFCQARAIWRVEPR